MKNVNETIQKTEYNLEISEQNDIRDTYILRTKLYAPHPPENAVIRHRLMKKLNKFSRYNSTMVTAPAGYGKTTLVSEWLKTVQIPFFWISLDDGDNDFFRFITYLIKALQNIDKNIGQLINGLFGTPQLISFDVVMNILINDISILKKDFILILDDYHVINNKFIQKSIQYLLEHQPKNIHLVIMTRVTPPLSLSRLRSHGKLNEIDTKDLSFTTNEIEEFFLRTMKLNINKESLKILEEKTEGWAAGLQLTGLSLQGLDSEQFSRAMVNFSGNHHYITDYLLEEILNKHDIKICIFLYQTSILSRFNASLCDAIMDINDSKEILDYLRKGNLFLVSLDEKREWYRYHHLLSDVLSAGLGKPEKEMLHLRAAKWLEENGCFLEAVEHGIASKNYDEAIKLIEKSAMEIIFDRIEYSTFLKWLDFIPPEKVYGSEILSVYKLFCYLLLGRIEDTRVLIYSLEKNEKLIKNSLCYGLLLAIKSCLLLTEKDHRALELAQRSVNLIGDNSPMLLIQAFNALGYAYDLIGDMDQVVEAYRNSMNLSEKMGYATQSIGAGFFLATALNKRGKLKEAMEVANYLIEKYHNKREKVLPIFILYLPLGNIYYDYDDLINAKKYLYDGVSICSGLNLTHVFGEGEWALSSLQYELGDVQTALAQIKEATKVAKKAYANKNYAMLKATEMEIYLKEGDIKKVRRWIREEKLSPDCELQPLIEPQYYTYVRALIVEKMYEEAKILLMRLEELAIQGKRNSHLIIVYILYAKVLKLIGQNDEALEYLKKAVLYGEDGYYRYFLYEGEIIADMLPNIRSSSPYFIDELVDKFRKKSLKGQNAKDNFTSSYVERNKIDKQNLLTEREMEVLGLIFLGYSNQDIAQQLFISTGTVKSHIYNIYSKLEVKNRTQALFKAKDLKILKKEL